MESAEDRLKGAAIIDELGFRNSVSYQKKADIVLLGDSLVFGLDSPLDLGEALRKKGLKILNLAMSGYSPEHWVEAFYRYGVKTKPRYVIAFLFDGNDFQDAERYQVLSINKQSYREYLGLNTQISFVNRDPLLNSILCINHSYFFSFFRALLHYPWQKHIDHGIVDQINIAGKSHKVWYYLFTPDPKIVKSNSFKIVFDAVKKIKVACKKNDSKFALVYLPAHSTVCAPYSNLEEVKVLVKHQKFISEKIMFLCSQEGIQFLDPTKLFQDAGLKSKLFLRNGNDTHLHPEGIEILAKFIIAKLQIKLYSK